MYAWKLGPCLPVRNEVANFIQKGKCVAHPLFRYQDPNLAGLPKPVHGIVGLKMAVLLDDLKERFIDKNKTVFRLGRGPVTVLYAEYNFPSF